MAKDISKIQKIVFVCNGDCCVKAGADENTLALRAEIKEQNLDNEIHTVRTRCFGQCKKGPIMFVHPDNVWYKAMNPNLSKSLVTSHLMANQFLENNLLFASSNTQPQQGVSKKTSKNIFKNFFRVYNSHF